jgi:hypothetical protein
MPKIVYRPRGLQEAKFTIPIPTGFSAESTAMLWFMLGLLAVQIVMS